MTDNLATDYAKRIARGFYDAEEGAPFGYRHDDDRTADTLAEVLEAEEVPEDERDEYTADNLPDGWNVASPLDYVSDALDFRYVVSSDRSFVDAEICISLGGPTTWINTQDATVTVYWGDKATASIPYAVRDALREAMAELWESGS